MFESKQLLSSPLQEENYLKVLRLVEADPHMNQRDLADSLGVSLGKTNHCPKSLLDKGLIKAQSFRKSQRKLAYADLLTPVGIAEKGDLTARFLGQKFAEYEGLKAEIEALKFEVSKTQEKSSLT